MQYAPSTKFYLADKLAGTPWVTRLPFPVHVVERVETYDRISAATASSPATPIITAISTASSASFAASAWSTSGTPRRWRHSPAGGTLPDGDQYRRRLECAARADQDLVPYRRLPRRKRISKHLEHEYYREGDASEAIAGLTDAQLEAHAARRHGSADALRSPTVPHTVQLSTRRSEACRALKGSILRQEIYALDGTERPTGPTASRSATTRSSCCSRGPNQHAVFFTHARETIDFHYERKRSYGMRTRPATEARRSPREPRPHACEVDPFGNVLQSVAIGYRPAIPRPGVAAPDQTSRRICTWQAQTTARIATVNSTDIASRLPAETTPIELRPAAEPTIADDLHRIYSGFEPCDTDGNASSASIRRRRHDASALREVRSLRRATWPTAPATAYRRLIERRAHSLPPE